MYIHVFRKRLEFVLYTSLKRHPGEAGVRAVLPICLLLAAPESQALLEEKRREFPARKSPSFSRSLSSTSVSSASSSSSSSSSTSTVS